jgi:hypothetical protein
MAIPKWLMKLSVALASIGAINWLFVGLFNFNLVTALVGTAILMKVVYTLVGVSGMLGLWYLIKGN